MLLKFLIGGLARLRSDAALRGMSGVFVLKAVTTILNLALITLAARSLGEHGFGTYSILFSAAGNNRHRQRLADRPAAGRPRKRTAR